MFSVVRRLRQGIRRFGGNHLNLRHHYIPLDFVACSASFRYCHSVFGLAFINTRAICSGVASMRSGIGRLRGLPTGALVFPFIEFAFLDGVCQQPFTVAPRYPDVTNKITTSQRITINRVAFHIVPNEINSIPSLLDVRIEMLSDLFQTFEARKSIMYQRGSGCLRRLRKHPILLIGVCAQLNGAPMPFDSNLTGGPRRLVARPSTDCFRVGSLPTQRTFTAWAKRVWPFVRPTADPLVLYRFK